MVNLDIETAGVLIVAFISIAGTWKHLYNRQDKCRKECNDNSETLKKDWNESIKCLQKDISEIKVNVAGIEENIRWLRGDKR